MKRMRIYPVSRKRAYWAIGLGALVILLGILGVYGSFFNDSPLTANIIGILLGSAGLCWGLIYDLWPGSPINVYSKGNKETSGKILLRTVKNEGEYGTSFSYYVMVSFRPDPFRNQRYGIFHLETRIRSAIYDKLVQDKDQEIKVRYAIENPRIAVFEFDDNFESNSQ